MNDLLKFTMKDLVKEIERRHKLWLDEDPEGERADFSNIELSYSNFMGVDFHGATFSYSNFTKSIFDGANVRFANMSYADIGYKNIHYADFADKNMRYAELTSVKTIEKSDESDKPEEVTS